MPEDSNETHTVNDPEHQVCAECGKQWPASANFCSRCGTVLPRSDSAEVNDLNGDGE